MSREFNIVGNHVHQRLSLMLLFFGSAYTGSHFAFKYAFHYIMKNYALTTPETYNAGADPAQEAAYAGGLIVLLLLEALVRGVSSCCRRSRSPDQSGSNQYRLDEDDEDMSMGASVSAAHPLVPLNDRDRLIHIKHTDSRCAAMKNACIVWAPKIISQAIPSMVGMLACSALQVWIYYILEYDPKAPRDDVKYLNLSHQVLKPLLLYTISMLYLQTHRNLFSSQVKIQYPATTTHVSYTRGRCRHFFSLLNGVDTFLARALYSPVDREMSPGAR